MTPGNDDLGMPGDHAYSTLPWRVTRLETTVDEHDRAIESFKEKDATFTEQIGGLKDSNLALKGTLDKVLWALIGLCITIAGSAVGAVLAFG